MSCILKEFINVVDYVNSTVSSNPIKIYINSYSRKNVSNKGDLEIYFFTEDKLAKIKDELAKSLVQNYIQKTVTNSSVLTIYFDRLAICESIIKKIHELKNNYGFETFNHKIVVIDDVTVSTSDLTQLRQKLFNDQIQQILHRCGCEVIRNVKETQTVTKELEIGNCRVGEVNVINSKQNTQEEFENCCSNLIKKSSLHKVEQMSAEDEKILENSHSSILDACIKFNLLHVNSCKSIILDLNENNLNLIKSGSFVMYNYARLISILHKFDKLIQSGYYPPITEINEVQFSLLKKEEEWLLIRDYLMHFPLIVNDVVRELNNQPPVHKILHFLLNFSHRISAYYSKVRILMDPLDHLMPLIFSRITLLKAVVQVMTNCFLIMDIIPINQM